MWTRRGTTTPPTASVVMTCRWSPSWPIRRWYLRFKLSYRDLAELAWGLGVFVAPSTILRWVIRYVPEFEKYWQAHERVVGDSSRMDSDLPQGRRSMSVPLPRLR